jgi:glycosyltransferase involved in cell wall biosynthesis
VFGEFGLTAKPIHNLIELEKFKFRERLPLQPVFLSNRNFETHYGVDCILRAFAIIQNHIPKARLIIAGDGSRRASLEQLARDLSLQNTKFMGRVEPDRIPELYSAADIFLNASEIDNQPLSIIEAFACGLPVVTTDAGGIPYMVSADETGLIVPVGDHEQLAASALRLIADNHLAQRLIQRAKCECEKYQWYAVRDEWLSIYNDLVSRSEERAPASEEVTSNNNRNAKLEENQESAP